MHASRKQSKETAQPATVSSHSHPDHDQKFATFTCFPLTPPNGVSPGVCCGLDQMPHTLNRHQPQRETNNPPHVSGRLGIRYASTLPTKSTHRKLVSSPTLDEWYQSWCQHRLRHADNNESQNSKRRPYQGSRENDAHNRHTLPPTQLQFYYLHCLGLDFLNDKDKHQLPQLNSN